MYENIKFLAAMAAAFIFVAVSIWVFQSKMEARAFNSVTGKNISTWDAMWIQLRVQEASK